MKSFELMNISYESGKKEKNFSIIFWVLSHISWILLLITGWISIKWLDDRDYWVIWTIYAERNFEEYYYMPFQMHVSLIYIVFIILLIIILLWFIIYLKKAIFSKDQGIILGMLGPYCKFHFIPLFCTSALFIIGECSDKKKDFKKNNKDMVISGIIFSLIGFISMIIIYIKTDLKNNSCCIILLLKKGVYSCLIVLMWYYFCYDIYYIRITDKPNVTYEEQWITKRVTGLIASIIFGIGSLSFAIKFRDLVICFMNILIYIGLIIYYFKIPYYFRRLKYLNKNGDGILDIIILILSISTLCFLLIKHKKECLES